MGRNWLNLISPLEVKSRRFSVRHSLTVSETRNRRHVLHIVLRPDLSAPVPGLMSLLVTAMDTTMHDPATAAVISFLGALPLAALRVQPADLPWLLTQLRTEELASQITTRLASTVAKNLGSTTLFTPPELLPRLADSLAIVYDRDDLVLGDIKDKDVTLWVATLQQMTGEDPSIEETTFRWEPQRRTLPPPLQPSTRVAGNSTLPRGRCFYTLFRRVPLLSRRVF